ncbi:hypothetical protein [Bdellovibrio bacteriovorus]|uniref:hypothetical protein n=1 Tax=Bdellovibrio bacteriovorus TaxID=959 RepID=UPI0020A45483|nr:hypothetical protein [Bdellovibrio bacteriovorus]
MQNLKITILIFSFFFSLPAFSSEWRAVLERAGFLGKYALGVSYEPTLNHAVDYLLGAYQIGGENFYQSNFMYRYSRWHVPVHGHSWRPLQMGAFMVVAMNNDRYFMKSPDQYPESNYYDFTAVRYGIEFGSTFTFFPSRLGLGYHLRVFDNGVVAIFNNSNRDLQYYISSGISLQYLF